MTLLEELAAAMTRYENATCGGLEFNPATANTWAGARADVLQIVRRLLDATNAAEAARETPHP